MMTLSPNLFLLSTICVYRRSSAANLVLRYGSSLKERLAADERRCTRINFVFPPWYFAESDYMTTPSR